MSDQKVVGITPRWDPRRREVLDNINNELESLLTGMDSQERMERTLVEVYVEAGWRVCTSRYVVAWAIREWPYGSADWHTVKPLNVTQSYHVPDGWKAPNSKNPFEGLEPIPNQDRDHPLAWLAEKAATLIGVFVDPRWPQEAVLATSRGLVLLPPCGGLTDALVDQVAEQAAQWTEDDDPEWSEALDDADDAIETYLGWLEGGE